MADGENQVADLSIQVDYLKSENKHLLKRIRQYKKTIERLEAYLCRYSGSIDYYDLEDIVGDKTLSDWWLDMELVLAPEDEVENDIQ